MSNSNNNNNFNNVQEQNNQILTDIQSLQTIEQDLYTNLEALSASGTLNVASTDKIIQQINEVSQMRVNLYKTLQNNYSLYQNNVSGARDTIDEQTEAVNIVENELNESKKRLKEMEDEKYNKLRYVEINTYYGKQYNSYTDIMKIIIYICIPLIILSILANKGLIPNSIYTILLVLILYFGIYYLGQKIIATGTTNNMNYDTYDWNFNPAFAPSNNNTFTTTLSVSGSNPFSLPSIDCIGPACCDPTSYYDTGSNMCTPGTAHASSSSASSSSASSSSASSSSNCVGSACCDAKSYYDTTAHICMLGSAPGPSTVPGKIAY